MAAARPPGTGLGRAVCEDQHQSPLPGDPAHRLEQRPPVMVGKAIMPEDHPCALGQMGNRREKRLAHARIGHQPDFGECGGVALWHCATYSAAMAEAEPFAARLASIETRIARAAKIAGRKAEDICLVAISKTYPAEAIRPALASGLRTFGENRVQEAADKWPPLLAETPGTALHLVGQLQSNKAEDAVRLFDWIHAVDRSSLVAALARAQDKTGKRPRCFIQVNIGNEPQKGGCAVADLPPLLGEARTAGLDVAGLMAVPPAGIEAAPFFAFLAKLARDSGLDQLSMGMSDDFETAIMLGATHIRIGSALFGARG
jgi:PLP dependent protein